jgi:phosphoribosylanthranilate isomerase
VGIIKVIRIGNCVLEAGNDIQQTINKQLKTSNYFLFDTDSKAFGGTGKQFDWNLLNDIEIPLPYFLSGGISDENINQIKILNQKPFALDINSKFEIEAGFKDVNKIKEFHEKL